MASPHFTKQHYIEIARIIRANTKPGPARAGMTADFADLFARDNPRFDRGRWQAAVGDGEIVERPGARPRPL